MKFKVGDKVKFTFQGIIDPEVGIITKIAPGDLYYVKWKSTPLATGLSYYKNRLIPATTTRKVNKNFASIFKNE